MQYIPDKRLLQDVLQAYFELERRRKDVSDYYAAKTNVIMGTAMSQKTEDVLRSDRNYRDEVLFLLGHNNFNNFVIMVPGFLNWDDFDELDEMLDKQIQTLKAKYK